MQLLQPEDRFDLVEVNETFVEILNEIGNNGGPRIKADLSAFSESRMSGCGF